MSTVTRAYIPRAEMKSDSFQQLSLANVLALTRNAAAYPTILSLYISNNLPHRQIWAWFFSASATWAADVDMVFTLNGVEVYREKIMIYNTAAVLNKFVKNFSAVSSSQGGVPGQLFTWIANNQYGAGAFKYNILCDRVFLGVNSVSGAAATFDAGLYVLSQAGV